MNSRISYNVQCQSPNFDKNKLLTHVSKLRPTWIVILDGLQVARDIKTAVPECNVIHRAFGGENDWNTISPGQWVANKKKEIGDADVWCYATNEAGFGDNLLDWFTEVIELAAAINLKVVIGNFSVGTPQPEEWIRPEALALLKALDKHRSTAAMGLHEYWLLSPVSGFIGGYPDNAGVAPNSGKVGRNLIPAVNWPTPQESASLTTFHCGRFKFMVATCIAHGINPPRVVLTEHGPDDVSDLKAWAESQPKTSPFTTIRGWKSCINAWAKFYPQWQNPQRTFYEMLAWADRAIYQGTCVEGQCIYAWGHTSDQWLSFDVTDATDLHDLLAQAAIPAPAPTPLPIPVPPPPIVTEPPKPEPPLTTADITRLQALKAKAVSLTNQLEDRQKEDALIKTMVDDLSAEIASIVEMAIQRNQDATNALKKAS